MLLKCSVTKYSNINLNIIKIYTNLSIYFCINTKNLVILNLKPENKVSITFYKAKDVIAERE